MTSEETVSANRVVTIDYTLKNDAGDILDSSKDDEPMAYLHGADNIVPGLETALEGKLVGDRVQVVVDAKDGYGEREFDTFAVDRTSFPDDVELTKGMQFVAEGEEGLMPFWIDSVKDDKVHVDPNHPLAGQALHFDVTIVAIRAATAEELEHGHPHGPGGHEH